MTSTLPESIAAVGEINDSIHIRRLELSDHERGFVALLSQLSACWISLRPSSPHASASSRRKATTTSS